MKTSQPLDVASQPVQVDDGEFMDTGVLYEDPEEKEEEDDDEPA